ncbi:hypothetical protein GCM10007901_38230 [Dyella acidisoli]|uniref:Uncharacterized protein n=1 Tax=Dyella acidisoli TaxID=1867834 RepID=A0ABQ5XT62_9GAMM|nr:hypothetical protein GCM10007901_38230 [Dyella acidisoli]
MPAAAPDSKNAPVGTEEWPDSPLFELRQHVTLCVRRESAGAGNRHYRALKRSCSSGMWLASSYAHIWGRQQEYAGADE